MRKCDAGYLGIIIFIIVMQALKIEINSERFDGVRCGRVDKQGQHENKKKEGKTSSAKRTRIRIRRAENGQQLCSGFLYILLPTYTPQLTRCAGAANRPSRPQVQRLPATVSLGGFGGVPAGSPLKHECFRLR